MFNPSTFITESTFNTFTVPKPILSLFNGFHVVHGYWRWFRIGKIYSNPDNFLSLTAGHGLNFIYGDSTLLRIAGICTQIARRILDCIKQKNRVEKSWKNLEETWQGRYLVIPKITWSIATSKDLTSPSTRVWFQTHWQITSQRIQQIALAIFQIFKEGFILSMKIMDAVESFSLDTKTTEEGVQQIFLNTGVCVDSLIDNKKKLLKQLNSSKKFIENILKSVKSPIDVEELIHTTSKGIDKIEKIRKIVKLPDNLFGEIVRECLKMWTFKSLNTFNCGHLMPPEYMPSVIAPWNQRALEKNRKRYPPDNWITRPSVEIKKQVEKEMEKIREEFRKRKELENKKNIELENKMRIELENKNLKSEKNCTIS